MSTRTFTKGTFQMLWDCEQCESKGLLGVDHRHCPNCGAVQRAEARYFPSAAQRVATKFVGNTPDWECERCGTPNATRYCVNCGAPKGASQQVDVLPSRPIDPGISGVAPRAMLDRELDEQAPAQGWLDRLLEPPPGLSGGAVEDFDLDDDDAGAASDRATEADDDARAGGDLDSEGSAAPAVASGDASAGASADASEDASDDAAYQRWLAEHAGDGASGREGAPRGAPKTDRHDPESFGAAEASSKRADKARRKRERKQRRAQRGPRTWRDRARQILSMLRNPSWTVLAAMAGAVAMLITLSVVILTWTRGIEMSVGARDWSRTTMLQEWRAVSDSSWCSSMPGGAYSVSRSQQVHHYNRIPDGQDCHTEAGSCSQSCREVDNGNGSFSEVCTESCSSDRQVCETRYREEPVYADHCSYMIDRWIDIRDATASGSLPQEPYWPELAARVCTDRVSIGCERDDRRSEVYNLQLEGSGMTSQGVTATCARPETVWRSIGEGSRWSVRQRIVTGWIDCRTLVHLGS